MENYLLIEPRRANLILIAYASSEGSGDSPEPSQLAHTSSDSRETF